MAERNLNNVVYQKIKQMMLNYELIPGQRLIFADLAEKMGVSRTPVNNALSLLAKEGFLDFTPNQGYTVHQITKEEADSLYEVREILELGALEIAIKRLTPKKMKDLEKRETLFKQAVDEKVSRGRFTLDQEFHAYIVEMSENLYLAEYFREVYQRIFLRHRISPLRGDRAVQVPREHHEIVDAIRSRDVERAKGLVSEHIRSGKEYLYSFIFD
jgi:GntR family transcriptional regulator, vanillate catabolism transcriptional regulator